MLSKETKTIILSSVNPIANIADPCFPGGKVNNQEGQYQNAEEDLQFTEAGTRGFGQRRTIINGCFGPVPITTTKRKLMLAVTSNWVNVSIKGKHNQTNADPNSCSKVTVGVIRRWCQWHHF